MISNIFKDVACIFSNDFRLIFILQQGSNLGADAASAIHNIIEVLNHSLGKTSTSQGQRSGQCPTVEQDMARFQFADMTKNNDTSCLQYKFFTFILLSDAFIQSDLQ